MIIYKIKYAGGEHEGYFVKTRKGFVQVNIKAGVSHKLDRIVSQKPVRINESNLMVEEEKQIGDYIN